MYIRPVKIEHIADIKNTKDAAKQNIAATLESDNSII